MKAMVLEQFHAPLRWQDVPEPDIGPRDALVRVAANGLRATDLKISDGLVPTVPLPHIPGHEAAGEVVSVGAEVPGLQPGDHVTVYSHRGLRLLRLLPQRPGKLRCDGAPHRL